MKILIKGGQVIDAAVKGDKTCDVLIEGARIAKVAKKITLPADVIIDALGKVVIPGVVDMHVHLREPGREDRETIKSATCAGAKGGVTSLLAMPNTNPPIDCAESVKLVRSLIKKKACADVFIAGCITMGRLGKKLVDISALKKEKVIALTDDGASTDDVLLFEEALKGAKKHSLLIISHCEDLTLSARGVVNLGISSTRMGVRGISSESEYLRVQRDIELAEKTGAAIHLAHISCAESVALIAKAKKRGVRVSAEATPHHFTLTEKAAWGFDANMKMNPPLRTEGDRSALIQGLSDGTIDAIASDHAPHTDSEKDIEFERANFGVVGLETILAVSITELLEKGILGWSALVEKLSLNPARLLGIKKGRLVQGYDADIVVVDAKKEWTLSRERLLSKSKNSSFLGRRLKGVIEYTLSKGRIVYQLR